MTLSTNLAIKWMEFGVEDRWNEARKGACKFRNDEREKVRKI